MLDHVWSPAFCGTFDLTSQTTTLSSTFKINFTKISAAEERLLQWERTTWTRLEDRLLTRPCRPIKSSSKPSSRPKLWTLQPCLKCSSKILRWRSSCLSLNHSTSTPCSTTRTGKCSLFLPLSTLSRQRSLQIPAMSSSRSLEQIFRRLRFA